MNNIKKHFINNFVVTHTIPNLTDEERETIKKDILGKIYKLLANKDTCTKRKVK